MPTNKQITEAVEKLRGQVELSPEFEQQLLQQATRIDFWKTLQPELTILDSTSLELEIDATPSEEERLALAHLARRGYFRLSSCIAANVIDRMASCVETLRNSGWPAVFSYVYDEFWTALRTSSIVRLLTSHLGAGYCQTSGIWTYRVDPQQNASGWAPHVDSRHDVERLSVWIPLTDATTENGCMYVIPQDCVPSALPTSMLDWTSVSAQELRTLLHNVTPLPARAGSILGWHNRLIHWGGQATDIAARPRLSIAAEFLRRDTRPRRSELPIFDNNLPGFGVRLLVIGQAILLYEKFEPGMRRYRGLATKLVEWGSA